MRPLSILLASVGFTAAGFAADFDARFGALVDAASPAQLYALLYDLPKGGDLHNHSAGSDRPEWIFEVLTDPARNDGDTFYTRARFTTEPEALAPGIRFRTIRARTYQQLSPAARTEYVPLTALSASERAEWCDSLRLDAPGEGRHEFFSGLWVRRGEIGQNLGVRLELLALNIKAFAAEGMRYLETQFGADGAVTNDGRAIPPAEAVTRIKERLARPDLTGTGLVVRFQDTILRFHPQAEAKLAESYAFVDANRDLWVGINMAGIEENGRGFPRRFLETYRQLRSRFPTLALSIHAGEMDGPDSHIRDTLLLGASRIGHGLNLIHDPDTLLLLQQNRRVLVEINLISNRLLEYVPDLRKHPFPEYLRTGVPVCLNTDDRGMWDSNLTDEYFTAVTTFRLSWSELVQLGRNSLTYSFAPAAVKAALLADYDARIAAYATRHAAGSVAEALARTSSIRPVTYGYAKRTWGLEFK
ncbi:adenosine deaminase family protein [Horticoccus sp. 23ND18S-11]|uniref:adenosine deaminase family protein n=1 Tax=Horticoccus sp. 23ND18S-11 TaxID=3391832 RepID=UPI0039C8DE19